MKKSGWKIHVLTRLLPVCLLLLCQSCLAAGNNALPDRGEIITAAQLLQLAEEHGQHDIVEKLRDAAPARRFVSDGCSGGCPQVWRGKILYPACFWHDARYYLGGSRVEKLLADARLMVDVCLITKDPDWAAAMFNGVWLGGNLPASWQWGKVGVE